MVEAPALQAVEESGWRRGFANLFRKENDRWWRTSRWMLQTVLWLVVLNGILAMGLWIVPLVRPEAAQGLADNLELFTWAVSFCPMFAVIVITHGAIVGEKQSGTAAWILSAPVSRSAFILTKILSNVIGFFVTIIALQGLVAYLQLVLFEGGPVPLGRYLSILGLLALYLFFYLTLTLMLGTFFDASGPVLGIAIAVAVGSMFGIGGGLNGFVPGAVWFFPETLTRMASAMALGVAAPGKWPVPVVAVSLYSVAFVALAIWRFEREEF